LKNEVAELNAYGNGKIDSVNDINFKLTLGDLSLLKEMINAEKLNAEGSVEGNIQGRSDALDTEINVDLKKIRFNNIAAKTLTCSIEIETSKKEYSGQLEANIDNTVIDDLTIRSISLASVLSNNKTDLQLNMDIADSLSMELYSIFSTGKNESSLLIPKFKFDSRMENWTGGSDSMEVVIHNNRFDINNFELISDDQFLKADGVIDLQGVSDFQFTLENIALNKFSELSGFPIAGKLAAKMNLEGNIQKPELSMELMVEKALINRYRFHEFEFNSNYLNDRMNLNFELFFTDEEKIAGSANIPVSIYKDNITIEKDEQFSGELYSNGIDVSFTDDFLEQVTDLAGIFQADLKIGNTLNSPEMTGNIQLTEGKIVVPEYGVDYNYELMFEAKEKDIVLEKLELISEKGKMDISGNVEFKENIASGIDDFELNISANDFYAANNKNIQLLLNIDLNLEGPLEEPKFNGSLKIDRALIYLDAFKNINSPKSLYQPLLVQAIQDYGVYPKVA